MKTNDLETPEDHTRWSFWDERVCPRCGTTGHFYGIPADDRCGHCETILRHAERA